MKHYIRLLRPKHALKNVLIFLPLIFGGALFDVPVLQSAVCGFAAFCCLASVVYIINDICDAPRDRLHPTKKTVPSPAAPFLQPGPLPKRPRFWL